MRAWRSTVILVLAVALVLGASGMCWGLEEFGVVKSGKAIHGPPDFVPGEFLVKFKAGVPDEVARQVHAQHGVSVLAVSPRGKFLRLRVPRGRTVEQMVALYAKNPHVEYAEPNYLVHALFTPNDPGFSYQWHLDNPAYGGINMKAAWDLEQGDPGVVVAVVDTGVAYENYSTYALAPDLAATAFVAGYDFINSDAHPNDDNGHGTHVTGTIAQSTHNAEGVAGVAFQTAIMPVKVLDASGSGSTSGVADGVYFAADHGARVINMSLGSIFGSATLQNACAYAYGQGVTIVCAAGNYGSGNLPSYPAAYNEYCIAVGATEYDEVRAPYSNYGSYLDLVAPGGNVTVDKNRDGYGDGVLQQTFSGSPTNFGYYFYQGTSMASPHVAGVAALLIARGVTGPDKVREAMEKTAKDLGAPGWDQYFGWGRVNAYAALNYSAPVQKHDLAVTGISAPATCFEGEEIDILVDVANLGDFTETGVSVGLTDITSGDLIGTQPVTLAPGGTTHLTFSWDTAGEVLTTHTLKAEVFISDDNNTNNSRTTQVTVQEPRHDVAVIGVSGPASATQGTTVPVQVTVENQGTFVESGITVTLRDNPGGPVIGSQTIASLAAGASTVLTFSWNTAGASLGDHTLEAEASAVPGETDLADNTGTDVVTITDPGSTAMYVAEIYMTLSTKTRGKNSFHTGQARVTIQANSAPVAGATVTGSWSGAVSGSVSGTTDAFGRVTLSSSQVKNPPPGATFTFTVTDVSKSGWTYEPSKNVETSDSITVP